MNNIKNKKKTNRIFYYDCLKALAIIGVLACHITVNFVVNMKIINTPGWFFSVFLNCFRDFSIPIFVMVSGALLVNKDYNTKTFIKKKFNRIFVPYVFWVIMFILFAAITFYLNMNLGKVSSMSLGFIKDIILGNPGYASVLWFVWMIIVVYIALFIINKVIKAIKTKNPNIQNIDSKILNSILVLFLIYCIIISLNLFNPKDNILIYYLSFVGYGILGYYLAKTDFTEVKILKSLKITKKKILISSFILSILFYGILLFEVIFLTNKTGHYMGFSHFNIIKVILSTNIFLFFRYLEEYDGKVIKSKFNKVKEGNLGKIIISLSVCSFGIYLNHILVKYFYILYVFHIKIAKHSPLKWVPFLLILVLLTSWAITLIMSKIPYLNKVSGK